MKIFVLLSHALNIWLFQSSQQLPHCFFKQPFDRLRGFLKCQIVRDIVGEYERVLAVSAIDDSKLGVVALWNEGEESIELGSNLREYVFECFFVRDKSYLFHCKSYSKGFFPPNKR
jgi:hypothetical protein